MPAQEHKLVPNNTQKNARQATASLTVPPQVFLAEVNLQEYPFCHLGKKNLTAPIQFTRSAVTRDGLNLVQSWKVIPREFLGPFEQAVLYALDQLADEQIMEGSQRPCVDFSFYRICQIIQRPDTGWNYNRIKEAILNLRMSIIQSENAWFDKAAGNHLSLNFSILSDASFFTNYKDTNKHYGDEFDWNRVAFSQTYLASRQSRYLRPIDGFFLQSLRNPLAMRLYAILERRRYSKGSELSQPVETLAAQLPMELDEPRRFQYYIARAHQELQERGYFSRPPTYNKSSGTLHVTYRLSSAPPLAELPQHARILVNRGVDHKTAARLAEHHEPELVTRYCDLVDNMVKRRGTEIKNPVGLLIDHIEHERPIPPWFAEQETKRIELKARQEEQTRVREHQEDLAKKRLDAAKKKLEDLPNDALAALEKLALKEMYPPYRKRYEADKEDQFAKMTFEGSMISVVCREYGLEDPYARP